MTNHTHIRVLEGTIDVSHAKHFDGALVDTGVPLTMVRLERFHIV